MEERLVDKIRKISDESNDDFLIKELNLLFQKYASNLENVIPDSVQFLLEKAAKQKQHNILFLGG